jgi:hypothetical protein
MGKKKTDSRNKLFSIKVSGYQVCCVAPFYARLTRQADRVEVTQEWSNNKRFFIQQ